MSPFNQFIQVFLLFIVATTIHLIGNVLFCVAYQVRIKEIWLFYGKKLISFRLGTIVVAIGSIPTGGYLQMEPEDFEQHPLISRIVVLLSGSLAVLLSSMAFLSIHLVSIEFIKGFQQIVSGALSPREDGVYLIQQYFNYSSSSMGVAYAYLATKIAAFNLLPIPSLAGGRIVTEILPWFRDRKRLVRANALGMLFILALAFGWFLAFLNL